MKFLLGDGDREIDIATPVVVRSHQSSCPGCEDIYAYWVEDADGKAIQDGCNGLYEGDEQEIMAFALNELAQLRAERDGLKREIQEAAELLELFEPITMVTDNAVQEWLLRNTTPGGDE